MASFARRRTRVVLGLAVLLVVLAPFALWLRDSALVRVERVAVTGLSGSQAREIRRALEAEAAGMTTLHVREDALLRAVDGYAVVRSLRTETDFPHGLKIIVNAYEPVAALEAAGGGLTAVAADGTLLRGSSARGLPVVGVRRTPSADRLGQGDTLDAIRLLARAPRALRARVSRVYRGPHGFSTTMQDGPKLYFGGSGRLAAKWGAAAMVLAHTTSAGASYVDLRVPERPVAGGLQPRPQNPEAQL